jgi:hypothetical protein
MRIAPQGLGAICCNDYILRHCLEFVSRR